MDKLKLTNFGCETDLTPYTDSMLFSSNTCIASADFVDKYGNTLSIDLMTRGEVDVVYKDKNYRDVTEFPKELIDKLKSGEFYHDPDIHIEASNWFETLYDVKDVYERYVASDGIMFDEDLSKFTPDEIKEKLTKLAKGIYADNSKRLPKKSKDNINEERG